MTPTVSVILPVHDGAATLREAVASVLAQTLADLELIVVDDASTDETLDVLASFHDARLEVMSLPRCGPGPSRNRGVARAASDLIAFIDADDVWLPGKLAAQAAALRDAPDAAVAYCWTEFVDEHGRHLYQAQPRFEGDVYEAMLTRNFIDSGSNTLLRKAPFLAVGGFDETLPVVEDWDLYLKLAPRHPFVCVPELFVQYLQSTTSLSNRIELMEACFWRVSDRAFADAPASLRHLRPLVIADFHQYLVNKATYGRPTPENARLALRYFAEAVRHHPGHLGLLQHRWASKALLKAAFAAALPEPAMAWGMRNWPGNRGIPHRAARDRPARRHDLDDPTRTRSVNESGAP